MSFKDWFRKKLSRAPSQPPVVEGGLSAVSEESDSENIEDLREHNRFLEDTRKAIFNILEDISTSEKELRKQTEELQKFQQATDQSFEQTIITDVDGVILYANHAAEVLTGYSMREIIGAKSSLWGGQMPQEFYETMWRTIKIEKLGYAGELINKRKDGTKYLAAVRIAPILDERGEAKFFVGMTRDITEERQSQSRIVRHAAELQSANVLIEKQKERAEGILQFLKSIGEGIFATDTAGRIIFMNETAEVLSKKMFQDAELKPANQIFCFAKETETGCAELIFITQALQKKKTITLPDHTVLVYDSRKRIPVSGTCAPIRDAHNEIIGTITVFQDVTQKHELDQMKDSFLSVAAHQLRTPLGSMRWSMELLLSGDFGKLPKTASEAVQQLYDNNQRMETLVDDLLDISRIEQNRGTEEKKLVNLAELVTAAQRELQKEADKRKIKITTDFPKESLPNILVSPKHIHEAIENLLSNSIKYNRDRGTVKIKIVKKKKSLELTIKDTGIGIPKSDHNKIFSKFFRATNAVLKETEGSGLGLSVVKSYLEESRAQVSFESEENVGTTFVVEFPLDPTAGIS
jgi:PAS domain S-box-containing protein